MCVYKWGTENNSVSFTSYDTLIWSLIIINSTFKDPGSLTVDYFGMECSLWYYVSSHKSAVKDGILTEIIESASSTKEPNSWRPFVADDVLKKIDTFDSLSKSINVFDTLAVIQTL